MEPNRVDTSRQTSWQTTTQTNFYAGPAHDAGFVAWGAFAGPPQHRAGRGWPGNGQGRSLQGKAELARLLRFSSGFTLDAARFRGDSPG